MKKSPEMDVSPAVAVATDGDHPIPVPFARPGPMPLVGEEAIELLMTSGADATAIVSLKWQRS
jgi:hypothetical protein